MTRQTDDQLSYPRRERRADRRSGRRDGRRRTPAYNDLVEMVRDNEPIIVPYTRKLLWHYLGLIEQTYLEYEHRTANARSRLVTLRENLEAALVGLDRTSDAVTAAAAELTEAELRPRNPTELTLENRTVLLSRRDDMRNRRIAEARGAEAAQFAALNDLNSQITTIKTNIRNEFVMAQTNARRIGEHCSVRVAAYWENVVLVHAEGPHLAPLLRYVAQILPAWVLVEGDSDAADLGRALFELKVLVEWPDSSRLGGSTSSDAVQDDLERNDERLKTMDGKKDKEAE